MTELSTETYILYNKTIIRGRNVLVQHVRGAKRPGPKRPGAKRQCPKVPKRPGPKSSGAKHPGPKSQEVKRPSPKFNWFRCYHTRCDNRHRILSRWFQLDYWFFELANQTQRYINFEYRKINNHCFSLKSIFYFFLPSENIIIKSICSEIIQNNQ